MSICILIHLYIIYNFYVQQKASCILMEESVSLLSLNYQPLYLLYKKFPGLGLPFCIPLPHYSLQSLFPTLSSIHSNKKRSYLHFVFVSVINTITKSNLGRKEFISPYTLKSQSMTEVSHGRDSSLESGVETLEKRYLLAPFLWILLSHLCYKTQNHLPKGVKTQNSLGFPFCSVIKEIPQRQENRSIQFGQCLS